MDNQQDGQDDYDIHVQQDPAPAPTEQVAESKSSGMIWLVIGAVVVIALGAWYFYSMNAADGESMNDSRAMEEQEMPAITGGSTTADITADLEQIPDVSADMDADASATAGEIQSL